MIQSRSDVDDLFEVPCVPFVPFRCPFCGRHKPNTYAVRQRMRYHRCQHCGRRYKSWEVAASSVTQFDPPPEPQ